MTRLAQLATMSGASAAQLVCNAGAALLATRSLGPAERGEMVLGMTIGSLCALLGAFGTGSALRRQLVRGDRATLVPAFARCSAAGTVVAVLLGVAGTTASAPLIHSDLASPSFLLAVGCFTATQVVVGQIVDGWYADGRFRRGGVTAAATSAGGLAGVLLASTATSAATLLLAQACGIAALTLAELLALRRGGLLRWTPSCGREVAGLLRVGAPTLGLSIGLVVVLRADRYVLGLTGGAAAVGVYSLAATLSEIPRMVPIAIGQTYLRDVTLGQGSMTRSILGALASVAAAGMVVGLVAWLLIVPVFGTEFAAARDLLVLLAAAELCFAPYAVASRGLVGGGWTTSAGVLGAAGAIGAVLCYGVAGTLGGAVGVAAGSVVVYAGLSTVSWRLLAQRLRTPTR